MDRREYTVSREGIVMKGRNVLALEGPAKKCAIFHCPSMHASFAKRLTTVLPPICTQCCFENANNG